MEEKSRKGTLLYQFGAILFVFGLVLTIACGFIAYINEAETYKNEKLEMTRQATDAVKALMKEDPESFSEYIDFYENHHDDMKIPVYQIGYKDDYEEFMDKFKKEYPGKIFGVDVKAADMPYVLQLEYYEYVHEYWLSILEDVRKSMDLTYLYFTIPNEETENVLYVCDVERSPREGNPEYMMLGDNVPNPYDKFAIEWGVWLKGEQGEFQVTDNEWGHVYTYYNPMFIKRHKIGLINADIQFDAVNKNILHNTIILMLKLLCIMFICIILLLVILYNVHIRKVTFLADCVKRFSINHDPDIAGEIRRNTKGNNEFTQLSVQTAEMIESLDKHVHELQSTHKALSEAQQDVAIASSQAKKDSLTGIRNRLAYDEMCKDIDYKIDDGFNEFGIIMIDLNFLKRINDTYGHDKGNVAIKLLCEIICKTFSHSPVFRIGGDEFVVIIENEDFAHHEGKFMEFQGRIAEKSVEEGLPIWERISAAAGMAIFNPEIDQNIDNVFKRADKAMYENKKNMKALRR